MEFDEALKEVDHSSTMGLTFLRSYGQTVESFLEGNFSLGTANPERVEMLRAAVWYALNNPGSPDPIRMFIKQEPHKEAKLRVGRYRLISAVSFVDTMADRVMLRWLQNKAVANVGKTSCAVGASIRVEVARWS